MITVDQMLAEVRRELGMRRHKYPQWIAADRKFGLLEPQTRTEPCSEGCNCMDYYASDEWAEGITCYRKTALLTGEAMRRGAQQ